MLPRLIVLLALVALAWWLVATVRCWPRDRLREQWRRWGWRVALWGALAVLVLAVLSGRLSPLLAALAAGLPIVLRGALRLLTLWPLLRQLARALGLGRLADIGERAAILTRYLELTFDPVDGRLDGRVREGPFADQYLSRLSLEQLARMLELYRDSDAPSAAMLETYLSRERGQTRQSTTGASAGGPMTKAEALALLGLRPGASVDEIRVAHRRLMQKLHPDRGGSDYLAARINTAKTLLLDG